MVYAGENAEDDRESPVADLELPVGSLLAGLKKAERDPLVTSCILQVVFTVLLCSVVSLACPVSGIFSIQRSIYDQLATETLNRDKQGGAGLRIGEGQPTRRYRRTFHDITEWADFWTWMDSVLVDTAYRCCYVNGKSFLVYYGDSNDRRIANYNRILSSIRMRQVRVKQDMDSSDWTHTPESNHQLSRPFWADFSPDVRESADPRSTGLSAYNSGLSPLVDSYLQNDYGTAGHVVDLPLDRGKTALKIRELVLERWTDEATRAVAVELNMYNPNYDVATVAKFIVEVSPGGRFAPRVEFMSCRLDPYSSTSDYFRLALEMVLATMTLVIAAHLVYEQIVALTRKGVCRYFWSWNSAWLIAELAHIAFVVLMFGSWVEYVVSAKEHFRTRRWSSFNDLHEPVASFHRSMYFAAASIAWPFAKLPRYSALLPRLGVSWAAMTQALELLAWLLVLLAFVIASFALSGLWLFGPRLEEFQSFGSSVVTLLRSPILGLPGQWRMEEAADLASGPWHYVSAVFGAHTWICLWTMALCFLIVGMFVAILAEAHLRARRRAVWRSNAERGFGVPSWRYWLVSKFSRSDNALDMKQESSDLRGLLLGVDVEAMQRILEDKLASGGSTVLASELAPLFKTVEDPEGMTEAATWISRFSSVTGVAAVSRAPSALSQARMLRERVSSLEAEIARTLTELCRVVPKLSPHGVPRRKVGTKEGPPR